MTFLQKILNFFKGLGIGSFGDVAEAAEVNIIESSIQDVNAKDPKLASAIVTTLHAWAPYLAAAAAKTGTTVDDKAVEGLQKAIAELAAQNNIVLDTTTGGDTPLHPPPTP